MVTVNGELMVDPAEKASNSQAKLNMKQFIMLTFGEEACKGLWVEMTQS